MSPPIGSKNPDQVIDIPSEQKEIRLHDGIPVSTRALTIATIFSGAIGAGGAWLQFCNQQEVPSALCKRWSTLNHAESEHVITFFTVISASLCIVFMTYLHKRLTDSY